MWANIIISVKMKSELFFSGMNVILDFEMFSKRKNKLYDILKIFPTDLWIKIK